VIYARVSSKEQEREGYSIPAQLKLLREYAAEHGMYVASEYIDVETAKQSGRTGFNEMVGHLRRPTTNRPVVLAEKTDRLYRNLKDWVTRDELDLEIHFVKEGVVLSTDSRSSEKFMHGIKVLMAKNYIDNLSEEVRKGMQEKAEQGVWPSRAPLGYRNVTGQDGKRTIELDPAAAPVIEQMFQWYSTGRYSLRDITLRVQAAGLQFRATGARVPKTTVNQILRNPLYRVTFRGMAGSTGARISRWSPAKCGPRCRMSWRHVPETTVRPGASLRSPGSSRAATAAAPSRRNSRRADTSITTARGSGENVGSHMSGRKYWSTSSLSYWGRSASVAMFLTGPPRHSVRATLKRSGCTTRLSLVSRISTQCSSTGLTRYTSTSSTARLTRSHMTDCRMSGVVSRQEF